MSLDEALNDEKAEPRPISLQEYRKRSTQQITNAEECRREGNRKTKHKRGKNSSVKRGDKEITQDSEDYKQQRANVHIHSKIVSIKKGQNNSRK